MTRVPRPRRLPLLLAAVLALAPGLRAQAETGTVPLTIGDERVILVAAGRDHSCVLRDTGRVFCWGFNSDGQLGDGSTTNRTTPVRVEGRGVRARSSSGRDRTTAACCATADGRPAGAGTW